MQIRGTLRIPGRGAPLEIARIRITVRDITEFDAPARTVAQLDLPAVHLPADGADVPFTMDTAPVDPTRVYALRAHADVDGSGSVTVGDLVTTTAHLVHPDHRRPLLLPLDPVGR